MAQQTDETVAAATVVFIIAAFTDYIDGYVARAYSAVSDFGKLLDPVADKILVMSALVMLVSMRSEEFGHPWVPGWMVVLVLARETWVTGLRAVAASAGKVIPAGQAGKFKSFLQMLAIVLLLLNDYSIVDSDHLIVSAQLLGEALLMLSIVFSYWGAIEYTWSVLGSVEVTPS